MVFVTVLSEFPFGVRLCKNLYLSLRATEGSVVPLCETIPLFLEKKEIASSRRLGATPRKDTFYTVCRCVTVGVDRDNFFGFTLNVVISAEA